jgi:transposase
MFPEDGLMPRGQIEWRSSDTVEELAYRYHTETKAEGKVRWHALWLLRRGVERTEVCDVLDINARTLRDWIAWYRQGGCAEVAQHHRGGCQGADPRLALEQLAELVAWAETGMFRTIAEVQHWVQTEWGVVYTYWGMRSLLDRLHIHAKVPRPQAATADPAAQETWKKGGRLKRLRLPT